MTMKRLILVASLLCSVQCPYAAQEGIDWHHRQQRSLMQERQQTAKKDAEVKSEKLERNNTTLQNIIGLKEVYKINSEGYDVTRNEAMISMIWKDIEVKDFRKEYETYESFANGIAKEAASPIASSMYVKLNPHVQRNLAALRKLKSHIEGLLTARLERITVEGVGCLDLLLLN